MGLEPDDLYRVLADGPLWRVFFVHPGHDKLWRELGKFETEAEARSYVERKPSGVGRPPRLSSAADDVQARMDLVLATIRTMTAAGELVSYRAIVERTGIPQGSIFNYMKHLARAGIVRVPAPGGDTTARIGIVLLQPEGPAPAMAQRAVAWSRRKRAAPAPAPDGTAAPTPMPPRPIPPLEFGTRIESTRDFLARGGAIRQLETVLPEDRLPETGTRSYGRVPIV